MAEFILKDQYGKEKTFNHDKIFVQGTDGELVQFTQGEGDIPAVLQDKTITENGTYTADSGYDGLGSVTVDVAGSSGGLQTSITTATIKGTWSERVAVNFGFKPLMILLFPNDSITPGTNYFMAVGFATGYGTTSQRFIYVYNGKTTTQYRSSAIENTDDSAPIYDADETGFNIGKTFAAGKYYVYAIGL